MVNQIHNLQQVIDKAVNIVFFTGAGMSTESGIPDFRSNIGLYNTDFGTPQPAEVMLSRQFMDEYPEEAVRFSVEILHHPEAKPNIGHQYMANLEQQTDKNVSVITQNIDGLHGMAGSQKIYELHGNQLEQTCLSCGYQASADENELGKDGLPHCEKCGGLKRDNIVLYGEQLDQQVIEGVISTISSADLLIIIGTSLQVYPAAGFINYFNGSDLYVINKSIISVNKTNAQFINASIGHVFGQLTVPK